MTIARALPRRTLTAIKARARQFGFATARRIVWTSADVSRLRKLYPSATPQELLAAFPNMSKQQIPAKARSLGLVRARKAPAPTGFPLLDQIRMRAHELNYSMVDLDAIARTKRYFQCGAWRQGGQLNFKAAWKAVRALDGQMTAVWNNRE